MRILICDDEQKLIDLELSILQEYCRSTKNDEKRYGSLAA